MIAKLHAYGVDSQSCMMIANYFMERKQRVKLANVKSNWMTVMKGAPQGSLMGPFCYNVHSNDLLHLLTGMCDVYNYADDNTVCCKGNDVGRVQIQLQSVTNDMLKWFEENMMKANPEKFQYIVFDKNRKLNDQYYINVNNVAIKSKAMVKLLGVNIDCTLSFHEHISQLCVKAGRKINILARLSSILDCETKLLLFNTFIASQFNYCPIWNYCSRGDMAKMEKLQYRSLKYVYCDFKTSYCDLLERSNKCLLYNSRLKIILCEVFKCINKLNPSYLHEMFTKKSDRYNTRGRLNLQQPTIHCVKYGRNSFRYSGVKAWNALPDDFKTEMTFRSFKQMLNEWAGPSCSCFNCDLCLLNCI